MDVTTEIYELWSCYLPSCGIVAPRSAYGRFTDHDFQRWQDAQYSLFSDEKTERARKVDKDLDIIRGKFGINDIIRANSAVFS